jgi:hypothetical protein
MPNWQKPQQPAIYRSVGRSALEGEGVPIRLEALSSPSSLRFVQDVSSMDNLSCVMHTRFCPHCISNYGLARSGLRTPCRRQALLRERRAHSSQQVGPHEQPGHLALGHRCKAPTMSTPVAGCKSDRKLQYCAVCRRGCQVWPPHLNSSSPQMAVKLGSLAGSPGTLVGCGGRLQSSPRLRAASNHGHYSQFCPKTLPRDWRICRFCGILGLSIELRRPGC